MNLLEAWESGRYIEWAIFFPFFFFPALAFQRFVWLFKPLPGIWLLFVFAFFYDNQRYDVVIIGVLAVGLVYRHSLLNLLIPWINGLSRLNRGFLQPIVRGVPRFFHAAYVNSYNFAVRHLNKGIEDEPEAASQQQYRSQQQHSSRQQRQQSHHQASDSKRHRSREAHNPRSNSHREEELKRQAEQARRDAEQARREAEQARAQARRAEQQARDAQQTRSQQATPPPDNRTPYEILGVSPGATSAEIEKAFRLAKQRFHPDRFETKPDHIRLAMEEEFKKIMKAKNMIG